MSDSDAGSIRIGTQGWNYDAWLGSFYPTGTRQADFLGVYARAFDTVEVDSTFYAVPAATTVRAWAERVPDGFRFALKLPQEITHEQRLRGDAAADTTAHFFDRARELGDRLGPVLVQLGPDFGIDELPALSEFLPRLPQDVHVAVEFRDRAWMKKSVLQLLADHGVALALVDGRWIPRAQMLAAAEIPVASFAYVRWMGPDREITDFSRIQVDRARETESWAGALRNLAERKLPVFGYFNNHFAGHSPESARALQKLLGQRPVDPATLGPQISLF
jgi:uncharacterized protein YecE (DUF72 family)